MYSITDQASLADVFTRPLDDRLKALLKQREEQLAEDGETFELARFVVIQPGDTIEEVEAELGFSPLVNPANDLRFGEPGFQPCWEWLLDHGHCYEVVFVFSDSGYGEVLFIVQAEGQIASLLALCDTHRGFSSADF